jgi:hypothetical protein
VDLDAVSNEIRTALGGIVGLRTPPWGVEHVQPPAAVVALPERITYDETYGRGKDRIPDLEVVVLVGAPEDRASRKNHRGVRGRVRHQERQGRAGGVRLDHLRVGAGDRGEFDGGATYAGLPLLAAIFHLDIIGKGA